jgi:hypothetical protein
MVMSKAPPEAETVKVHSKGNTTPLYIVCSPRRCIGKTLVSRLLIEFYILNEQKVEAFDLADEGPQLADYLPQFTAIADIHEISGQMSFFEQLIAAKEGVKIIDLSYRSFQDFFTVVERIAFFEEARRQLIDPFILLVGDADLRSQPDETLQYRFTKASLVLVRNRLEAGVGINRDNSSSRLDIPLLSFALRAHIDQRTFSFLEFWRNTRNEMPSAFSNELRYWIENIFFQIAALDGRQLTGASNEVLRSSFRKVCCDGGSVDQCGSAIVRFLQGTGLELRATEENICKLESDIEHIRGRAKALLRLLAEEATDRSTIGHPPRRDR